VAVQKCRRKIGQVRPLCPDFAELFEKSVPYTAVDVRQILYKATVIASEFLATLEFCVM
jgi:hypothetical protein